MLTQAEFYAHGVNSWLVIQNFRGPEEGGHILHAAKNNFSESSVSKLFLALLYRFIVRNNSDVLSIVQVERQLCLLGKTYDL